MAVSRRQLLGVGASAAATLGLGGCGPMLRRMSHRQRQATEPISAPAPERRMIERVCFGVTAADLTALRDLGREKFVDTHLTGGLPLETGAQWQIDASEASFLSAGELGDLSQDEIIRQMQALLLVRAVYSPNQLHERLVDFWSNHFNIYCRKENSVFRKPADELKVIRQHALSSFRDLLKASAHSPAMLGYLDNHINRKGTPNENYARELMELHSLGVHGGYTQQDVREVARCFTGWTIENRFLRARGTFRFDPSLHDDGPKTVLGHAIPAGGGIQDGERVLDILADHPSCATFISSKLCRYFLGDHAPSHVARSEQTFRRTKGDLREVVREILLSDDVLSGPPIAKRPFDFVVSAIRETGAETDGGKAVQSRLAAMGQPLYQWPMPDGFPSETLAWTGSMLARWNFALDLVAGKIQGTELQLDKQQRETIAVSLMRPEFQWR